MVKTHKLVIIGCGHVGSSLLSDAIKIGMFSEIALIDRQEKIALGEAIDQNHATALFHSFNTQVTVGGYEQCQDADIIAISASEKLNQTGREEGEQINRTELTHSSATIIREVMGQITRYTNQAIIICISNPVDTVTFIAENEFNYPQGKIFGTGTMLDSARLRQIIAKNYNIDPKSVTAFMLGEHGSTAFPVLSHANVSGIPLADLNQYFQGVSELNDPNRLGQEVIQLAYDVFWNKGWTNSAISQVVISLIKSILLNEKTLYPVTVTLQGEYGYDGNLATSLLCLIGAQGVEKRLALPLNHWEEENFKASADYIQTTLRQAGALD